MHLRINMPYIDRQTESGKVFRWFRKPGDEIAIGDVVCWLVVEEINVLEIPRNAKLLSKLTKTKVKTTVRQAPLAIGWQVIAREPGVMAEILVAEGGEVTIGEPLAAVAVGGDGGAFDPAALDSMSEFRVATDLVPDVDELPEDEEVD